MSKRRKVAWEAWVEAEVYLDRCKGIVQNAETCTEEHLPLFEGSLDRALSKIAEAAALTREAAKR